ncbi:MAG TPA: class I SAM-dependent methyltransferase [Proteobacteria bacterium]|nr:class I SAM-dependent methyltransferase [Pseudomonadota bacterium]
MAEDTFEKYTDDFFMEYYFRFPAAKSQYYGSIDKMLSMIDFQPKKILDMGCGGGVLLDRLKCFPGARRYGIDISEEMIKLSASKFENINFRAGSVYETGFDDGSFDLIVSRAVFQHLDHPERFLSESERLLTDNGRFILLLPINSWMGALPRKIAAAALKKPKEVQGNEYGARDIIKLFSSTAMAIEKIDYFGGPFYMLSGYGTGIKFFIQSPHVWRILTAVDNLLLRMPIIPPFGLNLIIVARKQYQ